MPLVSLLPIDQVMAIKQECGAQQSAVGDLQRARQIELAAEYESLRAAEMEDRGFEPLTF